MTTKKKSFHLVDPELAEALDTLPHLELTEENLSAVRKEIAAMNVPVPDHLPVDVAEKWIPGPDGAPHVRVIVFTPTQMPSPRPALLDIHGGGMVLGSADMNNATNAMLAAELGCSVFSVDYRLAPEHPHPAPVEDCYAALKWIHLNAEDLGINRDKIAVTGMSAGGGLAAALALLARDRGEVKLIFQHLLAPMLDDRTCVREPGPYVGEYVWTRESNYFGWKSLLGCDPGSPGVSPYASPARAEDLSGLPPAFISVGALDLFVEENIEYARRLIQAGVPTELHIYPGAYHGFNMAPKARITQAANRDALEALRRAFHG